MKLGKDLNVVIGFQSRVLPQQVIKEIEASCRNFLWSWKDNYGITPLIASQDLVYIPNGLSGDGLRNIKIWNRVVITKYVQDIAKKEDNLWVRQIHDQYFPNGNSLQDRALVGIRRKCVNLRSKSKKFAYLIGVGLIHLLVYTL